ncbi:uncharacterized protein [Rutidosis leptorrhynchoides]|uniref:uncharacterized protein n=1 Tax=Rutidosis leptorrhynchoides TaxID=125765 RepID=UPI003A99A84A
MVRTQYAKIWVMVDRLKKSALFLPIREAISSEMLEILFTKKVILRHGVPVSVVSDQDTRFTSRFSGKFHTEMGTQVKLCTAFHLKRTVKEVGGTELVLEMNQKIDIHARLKAAQDRQNSYVVKRRRPIEFNEGDMVMLKVSPWKGIIRFQKWGKHSHRFIGPFKVLSRVGDRLELPEGIAGIHNAFHVSYLRKCLSDESMGLLLNEITLNDKLEYVVEPVAILNQAYFYEVKVNLRFSA